MTVRGRIDSVDEPLGEPCGDCLRATLQSGDDRVAAMFCNWRHSMDEVKKLVGRQVEIETRLVRVNRSASFHYTIWVDSVKAVDRPKR